jgi:outer membrane lipoprotein SlyB
MIGKIAGAALGRKLAGRYEGGTGLLLGALAPAIAKRAFGPLGLAVGGAWVAKKLWDRRRAARAAPAVYSGGPVI